MGGKEDEVRRDFDLNDDLMGNPDSTDEFEGELPERRMSSFAISRTDDVLIFVVNKNGHEVLLDDDLNLNQITPLGGGSQGDIFAAKVMFRNNDGELETRHCVLKKITHDFRAKMRARNSSLESESHHESDEKQSAFQAHLDASESDETSTQHNSIKLIKLIKRANNEELALLPYCDLFLNSAVKKINQSEKYETVKIPLALHVLNDVCNALISLHLDKELVHRDIKPDNIGFYRGHWCLIDFDCAKKLGAHVSSYSGTVNYSHPSAIYNSENTTNPATDLFALGETILFIFNQNATYQSYRDAVATKDGEYRDALKIKHEQGISAPSLSTSVEAASDIEDKIKVIARALTQKLASDQPSLLELKECILRVMEKYFAENNHPNAEKILNQFYEEAKSSGYFDDNVPHSPKKYRSELSLRPPGLFSSGSPRSSISSPAPSSTRSSISPYSSDEEEKPQHTVK